MTDMVDRKKNPRPRYLTVVWLLLLVLGAFFVFAAASDLLSDARIGIPADHSATLLALSGVSWEAACLTSIRVAGGNSNCR